jgi:hypothetical protein
VVVYMYARAWLFTANRRYDSNASEGALSGAIARHQSVHLTYSTSVLRARGPDFNVFSTTRPFVTC